jgi:hypothetical protein
MHSAAKPNDSIAFGYPIATQAAPYKSMLSRVVAITPRYRQIKGGASSRLVDRLEFFVEFLCGFGARFGEAGNAQINNRCQV